MKKLLTLAVAMCCVAVAAVEKIPAELASVAKEKIIDVSASLYGKVKVADKDSPTGKAVVQYPNPKGKKFFYNGGVFCPDFHKKFKKVIGYKQWTSFPADENYRWYKMDWNGPAKGRIEANASIYIGNWTSGCYLKPNKGVYDYWVCVKFQGPFFVANSKNKDAIYLGKVLLVKKD